jgi:hypothetical protein
MKNDIIYNGIIGETLVKIKDTGATEMAEKCGYTLEEWDEPTATMIVGDNKYVVPIFGKLPTEITNEIVIKLLNQSNTIRKERR